MPDLIHLAVPAFLLLMLLEALSSCRARGFAPVMIMTMRGSNPRYIDRNHGGTLIIWDKLFRTFEPENPAFRARI